MTVILGLIAVSSLAGDITRTLTAHVLMAFFDCCGQGKEIQSVNYRLVIKGSLLLQSESIPWWEIIYISLNVSSI